MSYYPSAYSHHSHAQSHHSHNPIMFGGGHTHSHVSHPANNEFYPQPAYGGDNVVYVPSHRSHRSHHTSTVVPSSGGTVIYAGSGRHRHRSHRSHGHHSGHRSSRGISFFERIRRFFGMRPRSRHYKTKGSNSSWGFLGRSKRSRYVDARTGGEVDRKGRPIYRV
ncbi:hypothetical protein K435DRAFT_18213 [Dendrothele bispora CBS 962.96]|uniref:Uncharacterized protein n=1 Tax=Dendrothele bispora (strain CBS 962.96) TaxID=1314807 RepID=A0A4S8MZN7_DENBC|nr:hypothetical protein K435DRAFT_18213 [Dendrothele bispora CBS 962.96]